MPYEGDHEDLKISRGVLFGLLLAVPIWLFIAAISYVLYRVMSG